MNILSSFFISLLAGLSTLIGYLFIYVKSNNINKLITLFLSLSFTVMMGISLLELIPKSLLYLYYHSSMYYIIILMVFLASLILIYVIDHLVVKNEDKLYKIGLISMIILMLHNFPEGIITFLTSTIDMKLGLKVGISIAMHNLPEGIIIAIPIYYASKSKSRAFIYTLLSSLAEPTGALCAYLFLYKLISDLHIYIILLFVGNLMIMLSINELYPKMIEYKEYKSMIIGIIIGVLIIVSSTLISF